MVPEPVAVRALQMGAEREALVGLRGVPANKTMLADIGIIVVDSLTYAGYANDEPYFHEQIIFCNDTPGSKVQMVWRRELGFRVRATRKTRMRRLSYGWLAGLCEQVIDSNRRPLTFFEFTFKEFEHDKEGNWIDDMSDGNDHSIDAARYTMLNDVLRG